MGVSLKMHRIKVHGLLQFLVLFETLSLMGYYNHSIVVEAKIMVSTNCPIVGEQVAANFVAQ